MTLVADRTDEQVLADIGGALIGRRPIVCETPPAFSASGAGAGVGIRSNHAYAPSAVTEDTIMLQDPNDHRPRRVPVATFRALFRAYRIVADAAPSIRPPTGRSGSRHTRPRPMLAPVETRYARSAMVACSDHVATGAGVAMLRAGGSAADAALAASAVLAVTWPQHCGPGGDLFALVHVPGEDEPAVLNASGRAGSGADSVRLREAGESEMPARGDVRAVTVPGCVDGWVALHERYGRLALADVLEPARRLADDGFAASPQLAGAAAELPAEHELRAAAERPGTVVRRPGIAGALAAVARDGRDRLLRRRVRRGACSRSATASSPRTTSSGPAPTGSPRSACPSGAAGSGPCRPTPRAT